jgi:CHAT domain-containing protein
MTRWQRGLGTLVCLAFASCAWGQLQEAHTPAGSPAQALQRASQLLASLTDERDKTQSYAQCAAELTPWLDEALQHAQLGAEEPFAHYLATCLFNETGNGQARATEPEVRAFFDPWVAAGERMPGADPLRRTRQMLAYRRLLQNMGLKSDAAAIFQREVAERIARFRAKPDDAAVTAELAYIARSVHGSWMYQDEVRQLHMWLEAGLGADDRSTLVVLRALAYHERFLGRPQQALVFIERASTLAQQRHAGDALFNAHMSTEHAACLAAAGRLAEARQRMLAAGKVFAAQHPLPLESLTRIETNLANMSLDMADFDSAVRHADAAIAHGQQSKLPLLAVENRVPRATREVARMQLQQADAAEKLRQALEETGGEEMHVGAQAFALVEHAARNGDAAALDWAVDFTDLHIRRFRGPLQSDSALRPLMQAWREGGLALQSTSVRQHLDRALAISLNGRSPGTLALVQFNLARHLAQTEPDTAIWLSKRAANELQRLRTGLPTGEPELHRIWLGAHEADLRAFIALLVDQGRLVEVQQALELLRDQESHEYRRRSARRLETAGKALSFTPAEALRNQALAQAADQSERAARAADASLEAWGRVGVRTTYVDPQAQAATEEIADSLRRIVDQAPALARSLPAQPDLGPPLLHGHGRLTYFMRDDALDIVVQVGRRLQRTSVRVSRAALNNVIQRARADLSSPQNDPLLVLQQLHALLLRPALPLLTAQRTRQLHLVPDGALRYVPFGALHDGKAFAIERFTMSVRWSGSGAVRADVDPPKRGGGMVAFGRTQGSDDDAPLPGIRNELTALQRLGVRTRLDDEFTEASLRTALARGPTVVHLATHFTLDAAGEDKSVLLLGDGTRLPLSALAAMPWRGVRLAVLSACDSGVPVQPGAGMALVGFASTLQRAGVANVLATLWRVSDDATARWVQQFYGAPSTPSVRARPRPSALNAEKVAAVQRTWLHDHAQTPLAHPHYWSAFTWLEGQ